MAKRGTEFISERPMAKGVRQYKPGVIRVRKETWQGGMRYVMNDWLPVPAWMRRLNGHTWRSVLARLAIALGAAVWVAWRLIGGTR